MQTVRLGDRGEDVRYAQQRLNVHGANPRLVEDGIFGNGTDGAARQFQADSDLTVDGIIGPNTWQKLEEAPEGQVRPPCMGNGLRVSAWSNRRGSQWLSSMSEWCDLAHRMGISEIALMLDEQTDGGWTLGKYGGDPERVVKVCEGLRSNGITPVLVTWPVPKREQLDLVIAEFIDLVHA